MGFTHTAHVESSLCGQHAKNILQHAINKSLKLYSFVCRHSMFDMDTANVDDPELVEVDKKIKSKVSIMVTNLF